MSKIENAKTYLGKELENIFFRPLFADEGARELGIKVMYNMPACLLYTSDAADE